nr:MULTISPECIES: polysaccharide biosynthesis C-terminal domain-containing protein [unclassified Lentimicrobium]
MINQENILFIIGENYRPGLYVIFFIGLSNVLELSTGVVNLILFNSKYYRYSSHFIFIFVILVVISNLILIPQYGIIGAALATFLSKTIYMIIKVVFVKLNLGYSPYTWKTIIPIIIIIIVYVIQLLLPKQNNFIIDIISRSTIASILFLVPIIWFQVSSDINQWLNKIYSTIKNKVKQPK